MATRTRCTLLALLFGCYLQTGCEAPSNAPPEEPFYAGVSDAFRAEGSEDDVIALLRDLDRASIDSAFARLPSYSYLRRVRTEQLRDQDQATIAFEERVFRHSTRHGERIVDVLATDSAGTFRIGTAGRVFATRNDEMDPTNPLPHLLPDEPAYLADRHREAFTYRMLQDTLLAGRTVRVLEVRAVPDTDQRLRHLLFHVDPVDNALLGVYIEQRETALLFHEGSRFLVALGLAPDGRLVPDSLHYATNVRLPFRTSRFVEMATGFSAFSRERP
jgi:hypothetical protein